jgi:hypothetical protein
MDEGWTRLIFDTFNVPYSSLKDHDARKGSLRTNYDVVILPSQMSRDLTEGYAAGTMPAEHTGGITEAGLANLQEFVTKGGTLVCFDHSCEVVINRLKIPMRNALQGVPSSDFYCPGSVVALDLDTSHPIARGVTRSLNAYFINSSAFETADPAIRVVARYAKENVLRSGWLLGEEKLSGKIALAEFKVGSGRVVLFGFRPQHRGQTWATLPLIWNALLPKDM